MQYHQYSNAANYYFSNISHYPIQSFQPLYRQQQLNPQLFMDSAKGSQKILNDANKIVQKVANDRNFAHEVMVASRNSQFDRVNQLLKSIGINSDLEIWFNPDGIRIELRSGTSEKGKSTLILSLAWQEFPYYA